MRALSLLMAFSALTVAALPLAAVSEPLAPAAASSAEPARCSGGACDAINRACGDCLPEAGTQAGRCMLEACATVDQACQKLLHTRCLA